MIINLTNDLSVMFTSLDKVSHSGGLPRLACLPACFSQLLGWLAHNLMQAQDACAQADPGACSACCALACAQVHSSEEPQKHQITKAFVTSAAMATVGVGSLILLLCLADPDKINAWSGEPL